jgi:hypothetical protein
MRADEGSGRPPDQVSTAADEQCLGAFRLRERHSGPADVIPGLAGALLFCGFMVVVLVLLSDGLRAPETGWLVLAVVAVAVAVCIGSAMQAAKIERTTLYEFDAGLVHETPTDMVVFPWRDVEFVETFRTVVTTGQGGGRTVIREFLVRRRDGSAVLELKKSSADRIADQVAAEVVERARQCLANGEGVSFGPVTVGADRLTVHDRSIGWAEVDRVIREKNTLRVYRPGEREPWASADVAEVPDGRAVLTLAAWRSRDG